MLGIAFGKVIDISNVNNLVSKKLQKEPNPIFRCQTYAILLIFKEYEALYASSGWTGNPGPESSFLMRVVLPHSMQTIGQQDMVM